MEQEHITLFLSLSILLFFVVILVKIEKKKENFDKDWLNRLGNYNLCCD
jgi:hypothetical protein